MKEVFVDLIANIYILQNRRRLFLKLSRGNFKLLTLVLLVQRKQPHLSKEYLARMTLSLKDICLMLNGGENGVIIQTLTQVC
jgi:hypothetical protein